jgi:uncharacterized protein (DUF488 family)
MQWIPVSMNGCSEANMGRLFTIGYSGLSIERFLEILKRYGVDVLCDVRSVPYSRFRPEYSRRALKVSLNQSGIKYAFFGNELGARPKERNVYVDGQAKYDLIAQTDFFQSGLDRLRKGVSDHNLALMCSERDPLECHRGILVSRHLPDLRSCISHIQTNGRIESQEEFERRLVALHHLTPPPLLEGLESWGKAVRGAYDKQGATIAFTEAKVEETRVDAAVEQPAA